MYTHLLRHLNVRTVKLDVWVIEISKVFGVVHLETSGKSTETDV